MGTVSRLYSPYDAHKLLRNVDESAYNVGDLVATAATWGSLQREYALDPLSRQVYERSLKLLPILDESHTIGIRLGQAAVRQLDVDLKHQCEEEARKCTATLGRPFLLSSPQQVAHWCYTVQGYPIQYHPTTQQPTTDDDALAKLALLAPDDPVIQARLAYATAQQLRSHYVTPLLAQARCYPRFSIHSQTSGRWSTQHPPMSTNPRDGSVDHLFLPDPGEGWVGYDVDKAELWVMAAEANELVMLATLRSGVDIHTVNTRAFFGWDQLPEDWRGKKDERRAFGKTATHALDYLRLPKNCIEIPGATVLGFVGKAGQRQLEQGAQRYFARYPRLKEYHRRMIAHYQRTWEARSWGGRRRYTYDHSMAGVRALINHPFQAGVADLFDLTTLEIYSRLKAMDSRSRFVYQAHDSARWGVPLQYTDTAKRIIEEVFRQPRPINGHDIVFPITWGKDRVA